MVFKFTIDNVLNKFVPANQFKKLPRPLGHFFGVNDNNKYPRPDYLIWLEIFIGSFCGILLLQGVFRNPNVFTDSHHAPIIIASYGASAILCFNASQAPLAQPRNVLFGHFLSALIGVCVYKLFLLSQVGQDHYYVGGAISVGLASVVMLICNVVHPPAGASALLPLIDEQIRQMSWWYLPTHIVSSVLIICVALITGNIIRRYPVYWWTPEPTQEFKPTDVAKVFPSIVINHKDVEVPHGVNLSDVEILALESIQMKLKQFTEVV